MNENRAFVVIGFVFVFGGVLLAAYGPDYGIPRFVGELCSLTGFLTAFLGAGPTQSDWPFIGGILGLGVAAILLYDLGQPNKLFVFIGDVCLVAAMLGTLWFMVRLIRRRSSS